jgi:hypothetical protein
MSRGQEQYEHWLLEKEAKKKKVMSVSSKGLGRMGRNIGMLALLGGGVGLGLKGVDVVSRALTDPLDKAKGRKRMLKVNPELKKENKKDLNRYYDTLFRFSPAVAGDPLAAGAWMKRALQYKDIGPQVTDIKGLSDIEVGLAKRKQSKRGIMHPESISDLARLGD